MRCRVAASRLTASGLAVVVGVLLVLAYAPSAASHARGCVFPRPQAKLGSVERVYAIPHGCVRLAVPAETTQPPIVVVRQHDARDKVVTRRITLPDSNLDRAHGSIGICRDQPFVFLVSYPFVSVTAFDEYDLGPGRPRECGSELAGALLWTGVLSRPPSLSISWFTHRPPG